ncbi:hypothetical protein GCM10020295_10510 [Streptomyces cinereospinus]
MHLRHGPEGQCRVVLSRGRPGHLDPQRQPDAPVVAGGHLVGPRPQPRQVLRFRCGEGGAACHQGRGGGAGQGVGYRVQEGPQQALRLGQPQRPGAVQRCRVRLGRHRGGEPAEALDVLGAQGARAPGVVLAGGQAGQQQPAGHELQSEHGGRAPEHGRAVCLPSGTRAREDGQRGPDGQQDGRHLHQLHPVVPGQYDGQLLAGATVRHRRGAAVRAPEGDAAGARRIAGHEDGTAADQFGESLGGRCRGSSLHRDGTFLKFDYLGSRSLMLQHSSASPGMMGL